MMLPLTLLGMVVLSIVLPFIPRDVEQLPRIVKWFDNWSGVPPGDGLSGDPGYRSQLEDPTSFRSRYYWLALRNPVNYFQYKILGMVTDSEFWVSHTNSNYDVGDKSNGGILDQELISVSTGRRYSEFYFIKPYIFMNRKLCIRIRIGYKIGNRFANSITKPPPVIQWVFSASPFHPYLGPDLG